MSLQGVLAMQLSKAVHNPSPDGHRCRYCTKDARLAFRRNTSRPLLWQLLTIPTFYACWDHWQAAAIAAGHRSGGAKGQVLE